MTAKIQRPARIMRLIFITMMVVASAVVAVAMISHHRQTSREIEHIQARYEAMTSAIASGDTNKFRALYAPATSGRATGNHDMLARFARPLVPESRISFSEDTASVCPVPLIHFHFLPGGHTIDMTKVEGEWFFTGSVDID